MRIKDRLRLKSIIYISSISKLRSKSCLKHQLSQYPDLAAHLYCWKVTIKKSLPPCQVLRQAKFCSSQLFNHLRSPFAHPFWEKIYVRYHSLQSMLWMCFWSSSVPGNIIRLKSIIASFWAGSSGLKPKALIQVANVSGIAGKIKVVTPKEPNICQIQNVKYNIRASKR